jgi:hypothetical protein
MNQQYLPVKYAPQVGGQQGPYLRITCTTSSDHTWVIPMIPGRQTYRCPVCFGKTFVEINEELKFWTWGEETYATEKVDRLRLVQMQRMQMPMLPFPNQPGNLEDLLNSLG